MVTTSIDWQRKREELKARREPLFNRYLQRPNQVELAPQIRALDDQIAECNEHLRIERKKHQ